MASEISHGNCFGCDLDTPSEYYCYGCEEYVCDNCNYNLDIFGKHDVEEHFWDSDEEQEWEESYDRCVNGVV